MPFLRMTPAPGDEHSGLPSSSYQFATHRLEAQLHQITEMGYERYLTLQVQGQNE